MSRKNITKIFLKVKDCEHLLLNEFQYFPNEIFGLEFYNMDKIANFKTDLNLEI